MINIVRSKILVNSKIALEVEGIIYVSPAMYSLIEKAETQKELKHLINNIPVKHIRDAGAEYRKKFMKQEIKLSK